MTRICVRVLNDFTDAIQGLIREGKYRTTSKFVQDAIDEKLKRINKERTI